MARIVSNQDLDVVGEEEYWVYNGLDCCLTLEIFEEMPFPPYAQVAYNYERALQAPVMEMQLRGWLVNETSRQQAYAAARIKRKRLREIIEKFSQAMADMTVLAPVAISTTKLKTLLYDKLKLPTQHEINKQTRKRQPSVNREALETLMNYHYPAPLCRALLALRDVNKELETLGERLTKGRAHSTYNIAGTDTWRFSSSSDVFGNGTNRQNIEPTLRRFFVADPGYKLCNIDRSQVESRLVGWWCYVTAGLTNYLDACEGGDLHTVVASMCWQDLPWTGDLKKDKAVAESPYYRHFTYRDMSKRGGHASNYMTTPQTMSKHLKLPKKITQTFQDAYFERFPEIRQWHTWVAQQLQTIGYIDNSFGFRRFFLGRRYDDTTLRAAVAHLPQSDNAIMTKISLYHIWNSMPEVQVLHENHDNVLFQYLEEDEPWVVNKAMNLMDVPLEHEGRTMIIPSDAKVGWMWAEADDLERAGLAHPDAMISFEKDQDLGRTRTQAAESYRGIFGVPVSS